ncbi:MAG TPA: hypothetical protein VKF38_07640 [Anaerolineaceae bacterium]|nr:hypothetical protein [Anaerolineaceae bacterium]
MNAQRKNLTRLFYLFGLLLLAGGLMGMLAGVPVQSNQAVFAARRSPTPTRTPTPINTPTPTPLPYNSPTPGPTTIVSGSWKIVSSPNVGTGTYGNTLNAVSVVSANDVWAAGFSPAPSGQPLYICQSLVENWNGSQWSVISSPNPTGMPDVELNGVAAISASDIWAVGHSSDLVHIPYQTLTEHWNGSSWSIISSPSPGTYNGNDLYAVAAVSTNDVWAVGWYQSGQTGQIGGALTLHWDGTSWTVVPNPGTTTLYAIKAVSSNDVWAFGVQVILHWNGSNWSNVSFPLLPGSGNTYYFRGASGTSANDIWAVGFRQWPYNEGYLNAPITYHWDGTSWSLVYNAGTPYQYLWAVSALAPNDVWAVGDNGQMQHWNGAAWSSVASTYPGAGGRLLGLAATSSSDLWAVGNYGDPLSGQRLTWIDRYTVP